ncbi:MAG: response regulator [Planctomycetes bacterium]|nr:response regulator [Planctomycetota bacterium]
MKILIVDDSSVMRKLITRSIRQAGFEGHEIVEAENGQQGVDQVAAAKPDLILSDWNMPVMNGIDFLAAVRGQGVKTPFGFITTEGSDEMRKRAEDGGANFLLEKPFTPVKIANVLDQYITK